MAKSIESSKRTHILAPEIRKLAEVYYESLDCPRSLTAFLLLKHCEFDQLAKLRATPSDYVTAVSYHAAAAASDLLRKYPGLPVKVDPEYEARKSWYQSEQQCRKANFHFPLLRKFNDEVGLLVSLAADFVRDVLGACPLDLTPKFGPGATVSDPSDRCTVLDKVQSRPTRTPDFCLNSLWEGTAWERSHLFGDTGYKKARYDPKIVEGNTFFTVNKTALTHRGCSKAPSLNVAYQLAVASHMRAGLLRTLAFDLTNGQARHQKLAKEASLSGRYATIDWERASDTIFLLLVRAVTEKAGFWGDLLESLREPKTLIPPLEGGEPQWVTLEKFSAMGNGYTFELETIIFLSFCYAVAWAWEGRIPQGYDQLSAIDLIKCGHISVYGDDVIVPAYMAHDLIAVLTRAGLSVNLQKTYVHGEFRESCGGDYFRGKNVNTFKVTKEVSQPADWFSIHNGILERCSALMTPRGLKRVLNCVKSFLPVKYRNMYGPTYLGDSVLHGEYAHLVQTRCRTVVTQVAKRCILTDEPIPATEVSDANQVLGSLRILAPRKLEAKLEDYGPEAQLAYILYSGKSDPPSRRVRTPRYDVTHWQSCVYTILSDQSPKPPPWLVRSRYRSFFGITEDGHYVG